MNLVRLSLLAVLLLAGCASDNPRPDDHPLLGRLWDTQTRQELRSEALLTRAAAARYVVLGEAHDNAEHHALQARVLEALVRAGRAPALALEQLDEEHHGSLDAARARGERDPERIADAGRFDRRGWRWPDYRPLVELALTHDLPIVAANLSRSRAQAIVKAGKAPTEVPPVPAELRLRLERDIVAGHCGFQPPPAVLTGMVEAQRARDHRLISALLLHSGRGAVLIAGAGHARRDRGAPAYLPPALRPELLAVAFVEVDPARRDPAQYAAAGSYDVLWFTASAPRADPCAAFRKPGPAP